MSPAAGLLDGPVLVTGGTGFVAGHVVAALLDGAYDVRATVRPGTSPQRRQALLSLAATRPGRLTLHEADLCARDGFDAAVAGCATVFHVASPFLLPEQIEDPERDVVRPAVDGTRHVLGAVADAPSVRRVVLTSTVGAVFGDYRDACALPGGVLREDVFNTSSTVGNNPYHYAKTRAEQEAWRLVSGQRRWDLVSVNPGLVLGPTLWPGSSSGSLFLMDELLAGQLFFGVPDISFTVVDVREVAMAHVAAAERPAARGRYLLARREMVSLHDIARIVRRHGATGWRVPRHRVPDWAVRLVGPRFGLTPDYLRGHLGLRFTVDSRRSTDELGVVYRPVEDTVRDHWTAWRDQRLADYPAI